jgi:hypothetical protein
LNDRQIEMLMMAVAALALAAMAIDGVRTGSTFNPLFVWGGRSRLDRQGTPVRYWMVIAIFVGSAAYSVHFFFQTLLLH